MALTSNQPQRANKLYVPFVFHPKVSYGLLIIINTYGIG